MLKISVCLIVKNEELVLSRVLTCAKKFADEIIVVDTGSKDKSKQIAKSFTENVFDFVWQDDFAAARNFAFSKATCSYQMWLDADDFIEETDIQKLLQLKNSNADADVFMCKYVMMNAGKPCMEFFRERLLKRSKNFLWQGFVHEAITPSGKVEYLDIKIEHRKQVTNEPGRNLRLFRSAKKRGVKFCPREQYYYSRELFYNGYFSSAIKNFKKFFKEKNTSSADNLEAHLMLCDCLVRKDKFDEAEKVLFSALKKHLPTAKLCCKLGFVFEKKQQMQTSIFWFKSALCCPKQTAGFVEKEYEKLVPLLQLTKLCYSVKNFDEARKFHQMAKEEFPDHPSVQFNNQFFA